MTALAPSEYTVGVKLGRYEVQGEIARGAAGVVYRAHDPQLQRDVAIKVLQGAAPATAQARRRFAREARALARLNHPNVLRLHAAEVGEEAPYLVLDLIDGESLGDKLEREGPLEVTEAARITWKLAAGLAHCHAQGVLHRDLKPSNVLLTSGGEPLLADFGLVKDLQRAGETVALTDTGTVMGTPGYWSPEQAAGLAHAVDERTDVYSLGATLYALLTGSPPFWGATLLELAIATREKPATSLSDLRPETPAELDAVVQHCLAKAPEDRYPSADALAADLDRFLSGGRISGVGPAARRGRRAATAAGLLLLAGVALAVGLSPIAEAPPTSASTTTPAPAPVRATPAPPSPTWGWRLPVGAKVAVTVEAEVGKVEPHTLAFELGLVAGETLSGGRQRLAGSLKRISGTASGGQTLLPFDTDRSLTSHSTAVQLVLAGFFDEIGKQVTLVLGPRFQDLQVAGLNTSLELQRGYRFDLNQTVRRILGEPLGVLPVGPIEATWEATTAVEVDNSDAAIFVGSGTLTGRRRSDEVTFAIDAERLSPTPAARAQGFSGLKRYRRTGKLQLERGWVRFAESTEEILLFHGVRGDTIRRDTRCRVRVRVKRG